MATRMLIDARHTEETRVAVLKGNRIDEFDFESAEHKQIKGNVYLAKVTRVEPSLQAAFVDFGGNRHGFLAFSEIHPDYYQIPKEDRDALLAEVAEAAEEEALLRDAEEDDGVMPGNEYDADNDESGEALAEDLAENGVEEIDTTEKDKVATIEEGQIENGDDDGDDDGDEDGDDDSGDDSGGGTDNDDGKPSRHRRSRRRRGRHQQGNGRSRAKQVDEVRAKRQALRRRYKIQDVIQRRQVLLVQVVKEERGNKGAALTTHLSLAGRYTVLMPNSSHGGGISRKISSAQDRKRLKQVVGDLSLPKSMGLIVRTAGVRRTKTEIKRDFDYLARLWDKIREKTLTSSAPAMIHSDSDLIKRAIRDIYHREIEEVVVEGEAGYKSAKQFMKLLMPSHARRVKSYSDPVPLFQRYGAEDQLRAMYDPMVQLKSGGYLVINPTEALVSIDINSGRSTKEHGIEQTALATNLEAAREIARQLRLRDMAGLVVIDFIDMEHNSNVRKIERAMKDALKTDRARIQVGRISGFGLMEMSRQRLRTGVVEATTRECPHCDGTGLVRTASSAGLSALRLIEDEAAKSQGTIISLDASTEAAVYLLNSKRADLSEIESRYSVTVEVLPEGEDEGAKMSVRSSGPRPAEAPKFDPIIDDDDDDDDAEDETTNDEFADADDAPRKKRRRRRGGRGRNRSDQSNPQSDSGQGETATSDTSTTETDTPSEADGEEGAPRKKRRRGKRGGQGRKRAAASDVANDDNVAGETLEAHDRGETSVTQVEAGKDAGSVVGNSPDGNTEDPQPKRKPRRRSKSAGQAEAEQSLSADEKPVRARRARRKKTDEEDAVLETDGPEETAEKKPRRRRRKDASSEGIDTVDKPAGSNAVKAPPVKASAKTPEKASDKAPAMIAQPAADTSIETEAQVQTSAQVQKQAQTPEKPKSRRGWWQRTFGD